MTGGPETEPTEAEFTTRYFVLHDYPNLGLKVGHIFERIEDVPPNVCVGLITKRPDR